MYKLHTDERETILLYNLADGYWDVSTSIPAHMNRFKKLGWELVNDNGYELTFKGPKNAITFRDLEKMVSKKPMSEEQKKRMLENLGKHAPKTARELEEF